MVFGMGVGGEEKVQGLKGNGGKRIGEIREGRIQPTYFVSHSLI